MIITYHREKLINAIIYFACHTNKCGKTKLMKLLYFLDFKHFKETGKSVTGQDYYAWNFGPVPQKVFLELSDGIRPDLAKAIHKLPPTDFKRITPKASFKTKYFSKRELQMLEEISFMFKDASADEMVEVTHFKNTPWDRTLKHLGEKKKIEYELAIDDKGNSLSLDEAKHRLYEIKETYNIFGVDY